MTRTEIISWYVNNYMHWPNELEEIKDYPLSFSNSEWKWVYERLPYRTRRELYIINEKTKESIINSDVFNKEKEHKLIEESEYQDTLNEAFHLLCDAMQVDPDKYDTDKADTECYMDCFRDAANLIKKYFKEKENG